MRHTTHTSDPLVWYSSVDGYLGSGEVLNVPDLRSGSHVIEVRAMDSEGAVGVDCDGLAVRRARGRGGRCGHPSQGRAGPCGHPSGRVADTSSA
jgi:hypothetical protein